MRAGATVGGGPGLNVGMAGTETVEDNDRAIAVQATSSNGTTADSWVTIAIHC